MNLENKVNKAGFNKASLNETKLTRKLENKVNKASFNELGEQS